MKYKHRMTKVESGFDGITKEIINKETVESILKSLLECAMCKEIRIGVDIHHVNF